jgi:hypothetical protein
MSSRKVQSAIVLILCVWVALVQPGLSYFWLLDPQAHADFDADEYGQTPDGHTLPGHPWHPPHQHPTSLSLGAFEIMQQNAFDPTFYQIVFWPLDRLSLQGQPFEIAVIGQAADLAPPDHPPRA